MASGKSKHFEHPITSLTSLADLAARVNQVSSLVAADKAEVNILHLSEVEVAPGHFRLVAVGDYIEK